MELEKLLPLLIKDIAEIQTLMRISLAIAFIAVVALGAGALKFWSKYNEQRGAIRAQTDSIDEMKRILAAHTTAVEKVKQEFDYQGWHAKEHNALQREKLEKLIESAFLHYEHCQRHMYFCVFAGENPGVSKADAQLRMLTSLFFKALGDPVFVYRDACAKWIAADRAVAAFWKWSQRGDHFWQQPNRGLVETTTGEDGRKIVEIANINGLLARYVEQPSGRLTRIK